MKPRTPFVIRLLPLGACLIMAGACVRQSAVNQTRKGIESGTSGGLVGPNQGGLPPVSPYDSPLVDKFLRLLAEISNRAPELDREKDRRGKLRLELGANLGVGCMQDVRVKTVEVIVNGQRLGDLDVSRFYEGRSAPAGATGTSVYELSFGDNTWTDVLTFTNDENRNALFGVGSRKIFQPTRDDFTVGGIQRIRIRKTQSSFQVINLCDGATFTTSCRNQQKVTETDRHRLSSLQVKVNNQLIYDRSNITHAFATHLSPEEEQGGGGLLWSDDYVEINEANVKMKQRDDCTAIQ